MKIQIRPATLEDREIIAGFNTAMATETEQKKLDAAVIDRGVHRLLEDPDRGR